jgi:ArsR family transcriptional regulator
MISMGSGAAQPLDDRALVKALKALGDATRFRMMQEIAAAGELSCGQVAALFDVSQPTISHHLKILTDAGILVTRHQGKHRFTSVNHPLLAELGLSLRVRLSPGAARGLGAARGRARSRRA